MAINFVLTPIIVEKVGDAAYGFIGLANNFVSYANVFTIVINSMASRFITLELTKRKEEEANKYYSSVLILDILMSAVVAIASAIIIFNLHSILNIPTELTSDVKITFVIAFINLILSIMNTVFTVATFAKDRLDIDAIRNIVGNIIKAIFLIIVFSILTPKIYYITLGGLIYTVFAIIVNIKITKKIAPELKYDKKLYSIEKVKTLAKSGIWNSLNSLSKMLLTGLDLLIANIFVGPEAMGILSVAKTIPTSIETLLGAVANIFSPQFIILYSQHKIKELVKSVNFSLKVVGLLMIVPIAGFIAFGTEFYTLWLPSKTVNEISQIQILSVLSLLPYLISVSNYTLFILDTTTNKLKRPVMVTMIMSVVSTLTTLILLKVTNLGIFAVAGVSSIYWCTKVFFFNTINAAKNLRIKWNAFFNQFLKNLLCFGIIIMIFTAVNYFLILNTWKNFIIVIGIMGIIGYIITFYILLKKDERKVIYNIIKKRLKI
jgi:O-antigen/teichoic acid export membrane protein